MEIRSFLAFELPLEIQEIVAQVSGELRKSPLDVRWVKPQNIHLTVVFLGNIREDEIPTLGDTAEKVCLSFDPFSVSLNGVGCFPNRRKPRVLWLGLDGDIERMGSLRDGLQESLRPFGIKQEKRTFRPHLTLGRFRKVGRGLNHLEALFARHESLISPACPLNELILFKSDLKPSGAVYTKLAAFPLKGIDD